MTIVLYGGVIGEIKLVQIVELHIFVMEQNSK